MIPGLLILIMPRNSVLRMLFAKILVVELNDLPVKLPISILHLLRKLSHDLKMTRCYQGIAPRWELFSML